MTNCAVFGVAFSYVHKRQEQENLKIISMAFGCTHLKYDLYERVSKMHGDFFFLLFTGLHQTRRCWMRSV